MTRLVHAQPASRDDPGAPRAIDRKASIDPASFIVRGEFDGGEVCIGKFHERCFGVAADFRTGRRGARQKNLVEVGTKDLEAGARAGIAEAFHAAAWRAPIDGVAAVLWKARSLDGIEHANGCQQLARARRDGLGEAARSIHGSRNNEHAVAPRGEQPRSDAARGAAANNDRVVG